jgi:tRNA 2-thiouridine synthesizing protein A
MNSLPSGFRPAYRSLAMPGQAPKKCATDPAVVDARGLRCPLPALRLAKAVRAGGAGAYLLLADDPAAEADIPVLCAERGWTLVCATPGRFQVKV